MMVGRSVASTVVPWVGWLVVAMAAHSVDLKAVSLVGWLVVDLAGPKVGWSAVSKAAKLAVGWAVLWADRKVVCSVVLRAAWKADWSVAT